MRNDMLLIGVLLMLSGCGGDNSGASESLPGEAPVSGEAKLDTASPAIETAKLDCDKFKPQTAPEGQPADDIMGLRHGMTAEQVRGVLLCKNASYAVNTSKHSASLPEGGQISQINLNADTGLDKVNVWLLGPPDAERAVHIDRTVEYPSGKEVPVANITQEVGSKYGAFDDTGYGIQKSGWIVRSRDGQRITNSNSSYSECRSHNIRTDKVLPCLHVISYEVGSNQQNPALASRLSVALTSFAMTTQMVTATKDHQAKAVERAEKNSEAGLDL